MALRFRLLYRNCYSIQNITKPVKWSVGKNYTTKILSNGICCHLNNYMLRPVTEAKYLVSTTSIRQLSTPSKPSCEPEKTPQGPEIKKQGLVQRFKQMYRDYWYVLLPVHMATSAIWFGTFYYTVRSGVDILSILESYGVSEKLLTPLRESGAGYFALAFALYKLVTPLRYAVTVGLCFTTILPWSVLCLEGNWLSSAAVGAYRKVLGNRLPHDVFLQRKCGTTYAIKKLTSIGWIRPVPSRERLKEMLQVKKENLQDRFNESKQHYQTQMKEKRTQMMDEMQRYKTEMRNMKNKVKKS